MPLPPYFSAWFISIGLTGFWINPALACSLSTDIKATYTEVYDGYDCQEGQPIKAKKDNKYGFISQKGEVLIPFVYDGSRPFYNGTAAVKKGEHWGIIDEQGQQIIPFLYDYAFAFHDGLAQVKKGQYYGYINREGDEVIPFIYTSSDNFKDGKAIVNYAMVRDLINLDHQVLKKDFKGKIARLNDQLFTHTTDRTTDSSRAYGAVDVFDLSGKIYQRSTYAYPIANDVADYLIEVDEPRRAEFDKPKLVDLDKSRRSPLFRLTDLVSPASSKYRLMNAEGEIISPVLNELNTPVSWINGFMVVDNQGQLQLIDDTGAIRLSGSFNGISNWVSDGLVLVIKNDKKYYYYAISPQKNSLLLRELLKGAEGHKAAKINTSTISAGRLAIDQAFDNAGPFSEGLAFVQQGEWSGFINLQGQKVLPVSHKWARPFVNGTAVFITDDDKFGVINKQGKQILAAEYEDIKQLLQPYLIVKKADNYGVFDQQGQMLVEPKYADIQIIGNLALARLKEQRDSVLINLRTGDLYKFKVADIDEFKDGVATVRFINDNDEIIPGYLTDKGEIVAVAKGETVTNLAEGAVLIKGKDYSSVQMVGSQSRQGNVVTSVLYEDYKSFTDGYLPVNKNGRWGVIDTQGKEKIPFMYRDIEALEQGLFVAKKGVGVIDTQGALVAPPIYTYIKRLDDGSFKVSMSSLSSDNLGVLRSGGQLLIPTEYDDIDLLDASAHVYRVVKEGKVGVIGAEGQPLVPIEYDCINYMIDGPELLLPLSRHGKLWGIVDLRGKVILPEQYEKVRRVSFERIAVKKDGKWGLVNNLGEEIVPLTFESIYNESEGLLTVKRNGKFGFIDSNGQLVIDYKYDKASLFEDGEVYVETQGKAFKIDRLGHVVREVAVEQPEVHKQAAAERKAMSK